MPKKTSSFDGLRKYLHEGSFDAVLHYLLLHKVQLTITRERATKLGDYRHAHMGRNHRISVNGNLNKYSFLITLLHELAHLFVFEKFKNMVAAHGVEWKNEFAAILSQFVQEIFHSRLQGYTKERVSKEKRNTMNSTLRR